MIELLVLDVGNTTVAAARMSGERLIARGVFAHADPAGLEEFAAFAAAASGVPAALVSVNDEGTRRVIARLGERRVVQAPADFQAAVDNRCEPVQSVGQDRLFNAAGVSTLPAVVVDAGTAITVDLVSSDSAGYPIFLGGTIAPGVGLSFRALSERTGRLPWIDARALAADPVARASIPAYGTSTGDALRAGVVRGLAGLVGRLCRDMHDAFLLATDAGAESGRSARPLTTVITGGDAPLLAAYLERDVVHTPDLMLRGIALSAGKQPGAWQ